MLPLREYELFIGIGDLHGHYPALRALMRSLHQRYAIFQDTQTLQLRPGVGAGQTGDKIDRGDQNLKVIDSHIRLSKSNPYDFYDLLGNHELIALAGVNRASKAAASKKDPFEEYERNSVHGANGGLSFVREFDPDSREALRKYVERMGRYNDIGRWMRGLAPLAIVSVNKKKISLVHGGIPKDLRRYRDLEEYASTFDEYVDGSTRSMGGATRKYFGNKMVGNHSIFWDRETVQRDPDEARRVAKKLGVDYIVVGHTPQEDILNIGDTIFDIDVGMCPAYGEHEPTAILFKPEGVFSFGVNSGEKLIVSH
ncbi:MAG: metallophosphoesterase [Candidatus Pacearchaeota archaeon]